jgi:hypothetical protein
VREVFRRKPAVKRVRWGSSLGLMGIMGTYVETVGERSNWETVERHVKWQGQLQEDLRQLRMF